MCVAVLFSPLDRCHEVCSLVAGTVRPRAAQPVKVEHRPGAFQSVPYVVLAKFYVELDCHKEFDFLLENAPLEQRGLPLTPFLIRISVSVRFGFELSPGEQLGRNSVAGSNTPVIDVIWQGKHTPNRVVFGFS